MTLYEINQTAYANSPHMTVNEQCKMNTDTYEFIKANQGEFFMLMCHELRYYTIFQHGPEDGTSAKLQFEVTDILHELGEVKGYEVKDGAIEFWVSKNKECHMYVLFNYDRGVIKV